jgi:predicted ATPase
VDGERWRVVSALFCQVLECDAGGRQALLAGTEPGLRREVESLLAAHEAVGPFDRLASAVRAGGLGSIGSTGSPGEVGEPAGQEAPLLQPGRRLGRHEIRARLGAGGMGEVYRAIDTRLHREVAIKVLRSGTQGRPAALQRLEEEARAASALNHPNIVTVHDLGEEASFPYIVMELVEGRSLRQMIDGPLPLELLMRLAVQIAEGLVAAHERQVVHGDVKPENILVSDQGIAKIVDFGLAQFWLREQPRQPGAPGALRGTPGYLSPELVAGRPVDQRSDQFSLGAILHEMATGRPAFAGGTSLDLLGQTLFAEPPSLAEARPDLPAAMVQAIERCLRKEPDQRYPSTRELLDELRAARRGPARSSAVRRPVGPLPAPLTRLIGRQRETEEIERLLEDPQRRLLTLTGPGGTGKTRLALRVAEVLSPRFGGGIFFVPLASLTEAALVPSTIARTIGAVVSPGQPALAAAIEELRGAPTLLVLDNFEQVIDAGPGVGDLLAGCPDLTVVVTSREVLRIYGEHVFPVSSLALPDPGRLPEPGELLQFPAVALFVERAQAMNPAFALGADNASVVAALCAGLDGLPLAIELAAAQTRTQSPQAMLARLEHRLGLLTGGPRDLPGRQQTLRRTLDWSHALLGITLEAVFRRLAVFAGGFTLEAARAVVDPYGKLDLPVEEGIAALVDKSLLQPRQPSPDGEPRFLMLETLREYAWEKLSASTESERTHQAHAAYFLVLAEEGALALDSVQEPAVLRRFETEHDNLRAALEWLTRQGRAEWGLRMALALFRFWDRGEHLAEGRRRLKALLALDETKALPAQRARAMFAAGVLASEQGDSAAGVEMHTGCLEAYRDLGDRWGMVVALVALGNQYVNQGEHARARSVLEESLPLWEELGDQNGLVRSLANLAFVARAQGSLPEARELYQRAATMFERLDDLLGRASAINHEGDVAREQGDLDGAVSLYRAALATFRALDHGWGMAGSQADLGDIARQRGEHGSAHRCYGQALACFVELDHPRGIARVLEGLTCLAADQGQPERGLTLAGTASAVRHRIGVGPTTPAARAELEASVMAMRRTLGPEAAGRAWRQGAALSVAEALQLVASDSSASH